MNGPDTIRLTNHAILRYHERVRPLVPRKQAQVELIQVAEYGEWVEELPWFYVPEDQEEASGYLIVSEGVALVVIHDRAITCVTRAAQSPGHRKHRNDRKRQRKRNAREQVKSEHHGRLARRKRNQLRAEQR